MVYIKYPNKKFCRHIEKYWFAKSKTNNNYSTFEYFPDGNTEILFKISKFDCKLYLFGPSKKRAIIKINSNYSYIGIRFRPGKSPRIEGISPSELVDTYIELPKKIQKINTAIIGQQLLKAPTYSSKQNIIENFLQTLGINNTNITLNQKVIECIEASYGLQPVKKIAANLHLSVRQMERIVLKETGLTPKMLARRIRLQKVLGSLFKGYSDTFADLAYFTGYSDQSHFIKDFKELTGKLPSWFKYIQKNIQKKENLSHFIPYCLKSIEDNCVFHQL
ncbi:Helix-turn-helix domain-containing protein [Desulfonauticus submarinus]|uniref:Helix-turn-helix domain-containing protein n=1 Tax=Desulfonauticus submarinus TaxID=206665 RepID=A0A1H0B3C9_9BACT|nr:helix-turn-helix domain-containing protein [Desulfonauticus submarinus]SDN40095.1 Helix-turn-helix domain-containing protein [Desulfonauticus submarinus]